MELRPIDRVPIEIWDQIFLNLDTSADLLASYQTQPIWGAILRQRATEFMFESVLQILYKYLNKSAILACRQVCRLWCVSVNNIVPTKDPDNYITQLWGSDMARTAGRLYDLMSLPSSSPPRQVFVGRAVRVGYSNFLTQAFLPKYGSSICMMELVISNLMKTPLDVVNALRAVLRQLPNLQQFSYNNFYGFPDEDSNIDEKLTSLLKHRVFPETPHLKLLTFTKTCKYSLRSLSFHCFIAQQLVDENSERLEDLRTIMYIGFRDHLPFPNLRKLVIYEGHVHLKFQVGGLVHLSAPRLETLHVYYGTYIENQLSPTTITQLFDVVTRFSPSLTKLHLQFSGVYDGNVHLAHLPYSKLTGVHYQFPPLRLPLLKRLTLDGLEGTDYMSFDFMVPLQSLEEFTFRFTTYCKEEYYGTDRSRPKMVLEIHPHLDRFGQNWTGSNFYHSNIWRVLPKLKTLTVGDCFITYHRRSWIKFTSDKEKWANDYLDKYNRI